VMGLHLPGTAFVPPGTPLRDALTVASAERVLDMTALGDTYRPIGKTVDEKAIVNAIVGLAATGGSTNHAIHLIAIARAAGIAINWTDLDALSRITPLLARIYPNGQADVNHFHAAGGIAYVIAQLLSAGLLHPDILCAHGGDLHAQAQEPQWADLKLSWRTAPTQSGDESVLRPISDAFDAEGGLRLVQGNLGRAIVKVSAVKTEHRAITAPARIFCAQDDLIAAFEAGSLTQDFVAVVIGQGPSANGMPELHKLTPTLSALQDRGLRVALLTDGRMSGASGKVLAAIHVVPEAIHGGLLRKLRDGDVIEINAQTGVLAVHVAAADLAARSDTLLDLAGNQYGTGRELFAGNRHLVGDAEQGASSLYLSGQA
jgi:phosphogluconate dehydratase